MRTGKSSCLKPLPHGYRFWIYPKYCLESPTVCRRLPDMVGSMLALMITNPGKRLWAGELFEAMYGSHENGGPDCGYRMVQNYVWLLRRQLREVGIDPVIKSKRGVPGYIFKGFSVCDPKNLRSRKKLPARQQRAEPCIPVRDTGNQREVSASVKGFVHPLNSLPDPRNSLPEVRKGLPELRNSLPKPRKGFIHPLNRLPADRVNKDVRDNTPHTDRILDQGRLENARLVNQ